MSTLKVDAIRHNSATSDAITTAADGTCTAKLTSVGGGQLSHRNKARNGAMRISQRGTTFSPTTSTVYLLDGWQTNNGSSGNLDTTVTQSTDAPAGFTKSLKITPDSTLTPSGSQNGLLAQYLEGQDFQDLAFGTSDAKPITVSWYAKTSATGAGNYTVKVEYRDASNNNYAVNKLFAFTTTWTRFTYTIPATGTATTNGIVDDNSRGFRIEYHLFAGPDDVASQFTQWTSNPTPTFKVISGQKNFMDNTNNELYITGLQIEVGDTATSFEHKKFSDELRDCQRYFQKSYNYDDAVGSSGVQGWFQWRRDGGNRPHIPMMTSMRSTPTFLAYNYVGGTGGQFRNASNGTNHAQGSVNVIGQNIVSFDGGATGWNQIGTGEVGFMYYSLESEL